MTTKPQSRPQGKPSQGMYRHRREGVNPRTGENLVPWWSLSQSHQEQPKLTPFPFEAEVVNVEGPRWQKFTALLDLNKNPGERPLLATVKALGLVPTGRVR